VRQEQANLAAIKEKEVRVTRAQTQKEESLISADADAQARKIQADAGVEVAERESRAMKITADATAEKVRKEGQAVADVARQKGAAEAEVVRQRGLAQAEVEKQQGLAQAEVTKQQGLAEAEAERARLMAQADGERALAEARASNDKVNFEIEKIKIEQEARIVIATKTAEIMAEIGKNAEFVNIGGGATGNAAIGGTGNVLLDTLAGVPVLMKTLNAENQALNGKPMNDEIRELVSALVGPAKGLLVQNTEVVAAPDGSDTPVIDVTDTTDAPADE
jgi:hypothetical protein